MAKAGDGRSFVYSESMRYAFESCYTSYRPAMQELINELGYDDEQLSHFSHYFSGAKCIDMPTDNTKLYAVCWDDEYGYTNMAIDLTLPKLKWYMLIKASQYKKTNFVVEFTIWDMDSAIQIQFDKQKVVRTQTINVWCPIGDAVSDYYDFDDDDVWEDAVYDTEYM